MSDFDREAAREELREKFERDNEKRKTTQRMSELLLKGATMTNRHCDTCGDPIFRYQGQEFCPTCQNASVDGGPDSVQDDADTQTQAGTSGQSDAVQADAESASVGSTGPAGSTQPDPEAAPAGQSGDGDASVPVQPASSDPQEATTSGGRQPTTAAQHRAATAEHQQGTVPDQRRATTDTQQATTPAEPAESPSAGPGTDGPQPAPVAGDVADLDTARASLIRTLTRYSRKAESADDPRRARELLSVAHEAAETLSALDRTR